MRTETRVTPFWRTVVIVLTVLGVLLAMNQVFFWNVGGLSLLTGEADGYYAAYADRPVSRLALEMQAEIDKYVASFALLAYVIYSDVTRRIIPNTVNAAVAPTREYNQRNGFSIPFKFNRRNVTDVLLSMLSTNTFVSGWALTWCGNQVTETKRSEAWAWVERNRGPVEEMGQ